MVVATFRGKHNATKGKVFLVLYHRRFNRGLDTGLSLKQLADATGCPYSSIHSRVGKWVEWNYILRHVGSNGSRPVFTYLLTTRGKKFVEHRIPRDRLNDYIADIKAARS